MSEPVGSSSPLASAVLPLLTHQLAPSSNHSTPHATSSHATPSPQQQQHTNMQQQMNQQQQPQRNNRAPAGSSLSSPPARRMVGEWVVESKIGSGSFATVWKGYHKETLQPVAIKSVSKEKIQVNKKHQENLDMEIMIMQRVNHPNIVRLYETRDTPRHKYLVLEYCSGGDLSKYIKRHGAMPEKQAQLFLGQLAHGIKFLRQANLIHRDLKPQNLLLDSDPSSSAPFPPALKIADFGFARYMEPNNLAATLCGSPLYMAPEILGYKEYDASVDLWSIGGILYEMVCGKPPYTGQNHIQLLNRINTTEVKFPANISLSDSCINLLLGLLKRNPRERITFEQFFQHPFVIEAMNTATATAKAKEQAQQQQQQQQQQQPASSSPPAQASTSPSIPAPVHSLSPLQQPTTPSARTESILKSLQTPSSSLQQQQPMFAPRNNSSNNLYGSSPSQQSYMQQQQQQLQNQQQTPQQQVYSSSPHQSNPTGMLNAQKFSPSNSPPSPSFLPTQHNHAQHQTYQKPPQQQVGFMTPNAQQQQYHHQHQNSSTSPPPFAQQLSPHHQQQQNLQSQQQRPISRHNTPQNLRGSGDGSTSIEREYVLIDGDANSQTGFHREQPSPSNFNSSGNQPSQPQSADSNQPHASFELNEEVERARVKSVMRRSVLMGEIADAKLINLGGFFMGGTGTGGSFLASNLTAHDDAHQMLVNLMEDLEPSLNTGKNPHVLHAGAGVSVLSASAHSTNPLLSPLEQLAMAMSLYVKALQHVTPLVFDCSRVLHSLSMQLNANPSSTTLGATLSAWQGVDRYAKELQQEFLLKSKAVKKTMEGLEALHGQTNTVRMLPNQSGVSANSHSRRGSVSASQSGSTSNSVSGEEFKETKTPPFTANSVSGTRLMQSFQTACVEKVIYDHALSLTHSAGIAEMMHGDYVEAKRLYTQAAKTIDVLLQEVTDRASEQDKAHLQGLAKGVKTRLEHVNLKLPSDATNSIPQHQAPIAAATPAQQSVRIH